MKKLNDFQLLLVSVGGYAAMSLSFMLMPVKGCTVLSGLVFWLGMIAGIIGQAALAVRVRKAEWSKKHKRCGLLTFFANKWAKAADLTLAAGVILTGIALAATNGFGYVCYVMLTVTIFAFCMHCILNSNTLLFALRQTNPLAKYGKNKKENE